jgi:hypothetical protein
MITHLCRVVLSALCMSGATACFEDEHCGIDPLLPVPGADVFTECEEDADCDDEACGDRTECNVFTGLCERPPDAGPTE